MSAHPPALYKYLTADGAINLLRNQQCWYRCPLQYEKWDCRADLLANLDVADMKNVFRQEFVRILCNPDPPRLTDDPLSGVVFAMRNRRARWTLHDAEAEFDEIYQGDIIDVDGHRRRIREEYEVILRDMRVLCLCCNPHSLKMWHDYADCGRGVCIGFRYVSDFDNAIGAARPVRYVDAWPGMASPLEWARSALCIEKIPFDKRAGDAMYLKLRRFDYEQEWRVITPPPPGTRNDSDGVYRMGIVPHEVFQITFGWAVNEDVRKQILTIWSAVYSHAQLDTINKEALL